MSSDTHLHLLRLQVKVATTVDSPQVLLQNSRLPTLKATVIPSRPTQQRTSQSLLRCTYSVSASVRPPSQFSFLNLLYLLISFLVFPPFWLMGAFILLTPLRVLPSTPSPSFDEESTLSTWLPEKTEPEKEAFISHMRKAELKYAKRCLVAFVVSAIIAGIAAGLVVRITSM